MARLTSQTHPLRIDAVETPTGGVIGMTFCPGKKQRHSISGHWDRDLTADLGVIKDWGAEALVTLMEPDELAWVEVGHLGDAVEALGLDWYHLPIRDVHPPGQRFENRWILYGLRLRRLLRRGGRVVLHCRGGLGRTGTVAARLLVELGMNPDDAMTAVRAARPGTIETAAQEAHVRACTEPEHNEAYLDRALGCLLGGAIGDAFGYAVEFDHLEAIEQRFGPAGLRDPVLIDGQMQVSDDTQMTLFTLEGLARAPDHATPDQLITSIRHAYADWLDTQAGQSKGAGITGTLATRKAMRHRRAPGTTCLSALRAGGHGTPERPINASKGCGAMMRVAPIGWLTAHQRVAAFDLAARAGALTHGHPDGWASAGMLAALIGELFYGKGLRRALADSKSIAATSLAQQRVEADLLRTVARAEVSAKRLRHDPSRAIAQIGQGWVGEEALAIALYATLSAGSFEDAVRRAANHDGDSDSTAAIAGQIWGAWKGIDSLPMAWVRRLDVLPECLHGVAQLASRGYCARPTAAMRRNILLDPTIATCRTILEMVHLLHRRGYQRLRIAPAMAPSGCCWRVAVSPSDNILPDHGARLRTFEDAAHHTSGNGADPFAWHDARGNDPQALADLFLERYPELARCGQGADWAYAGWYLEVLAHAAHGRFPVADADWSEEPDPRYLVLTGPGLTGRERLLAPPRPASAVIDSRHPEPDAEGESPETEEPGSAPIDDDEVDLKHLSLYEQADRVFALTAFYHQWEPALMPFTAAVWESVVEPKAPKIAWMAKTLGIGGSDKLALRKILDAYLQTTDAAIAAVDDGESSHDIITETSAWLADLATHAARLDAVIEAHAQRWARLLNGEPMDPPPPATLHTADIIQGPWLRRHD